MLDGAKMFEEDREAGINLLRQHYQSRLVDGDRIPRGMKIQGIDVVDMGLSLVHHQVGLLSEIEAVRASGEQPCVVVFAPNDPSRLTSSRFRDASYDPNQYAVVTPEQARILLGNGQEHEGLRYHLARRVSGPC